MADFYWNNTSGSTKSWYSSSPYYWYESDLVTPKTSFPANGDSVYMVTGNCTIANDTANISLFDTNTYSYSGTITATQRLKLNGTVIINTGLTWYMAAGNGYMLISGTISITCNGGDINSVLCGGVITLQDNFKCSASFRLYSATIVTQGYDVDIPTCAVANVYSQTWDFTPAGGRETTVTCTGSYFINDNNNNLANPSKLTITLGGGHPLIKMTKNTAIFYGCGKTWYDVTFASSSTGTKYVYGENTFHTLTVTGSANKTDAIAFYGNQTADVYAFNGNSAINRLLVYSSSFGTARTLSGNGSSTTTFATTSSNIDLRDITAGTYASGETDLSAITGLSGDCGGNTGFTFTTGITVYWHVDTGSVSDASKWFLATNGGGGAGRVPLPQDTAKWDGNSFDSNGKTITQDMPRIGTIDFGDVTVGRTFTFTIGLAHQVYGDVTLHAGMTLSGNYIWYLYKRGVISLTSVGKTIYQTIANLRANTLTQADAFTTGALTIQGGMTWDCNGYNLSSARIMSTDSLLIADTTVTISTTTAAQGWEFSGTATFTCNTSTIQFTGNSVANKLLFTGNGLTYYNLSFPNGAGSPYRSVTISGSNTFNSISVGYGNAIYVTAGTTQTVGSIALTGSATYGSLWTSLTSAVHYLVDTSGNNTATYTTISYSEASGGATFDASDGTNTDGGNNTGWIWISFIPKIILIT